MFPHKWIKNKALNSLIIFLNSCVINKEKTLSVKLLFDVNIKDQFFLFKRTNNKLNFTDDLWKHFFVLTKAI